jgi:hypothetical protein
MILDIPQDFVRFELDAKESEINRLKRRVREMESITRSGGPTTVNRSESPDVRAAGARFNKDRDAEAVVESLRKVVDRLKAENERLKKGVGTTDGKTNDAEKRLVAERKKNEKLEEDVCQFPPTLV